MAMTAPPGVTVRVAAARVLAAVLRGRSLKAELAAALPKLADPRDRALLEAICFAALRQRARYDGAMRAWMQKPPGAKDGELRALLLAGFAQLDAMELPAHAALSATVEAARALGRTHQAGMVNALLRRAQREGIPAADPADAWPAWLRDRVRADWPEDAAAIFAASAQPAPTWLRVNRRGSREAFLERLQQAGLEVAGPSGSDFDRDGKFGVAADAAPTGAANVADAILLPGSIPVGALPGFAEGEVSVQDGAAQLVADALSPPPGARLLDACAAPGGKSAHLLERDPTLRLTALDVDARRLRRVRETFDRLGVGGDARLLAADAADIAAWWDGQPFDAILVDAPCSATGIVRRQPDILLHRRESDLAALTDLQARLLDALWPLLAPGGRLLYATCSILKAENQAQVAAFLARTPDARIEPLPEAFGRDTGNGHQRLPGEQDMDGFFYALVTRA